MAKYQAEAKCPICDEIIEQDDCYDSETTWIEDDGQFAELKHCVGHCVACNKEYQYTEVYTFVGYTDIREVE